MSKRHNSLTVAVVGATGTQGGAVVNALLTLGYRVRALTRDPNSERAWALYKRGAQIVRADLDDTANLTEAFRGCDAVFGVTTPFVMSVEAEIAQGKCMVDAAKFAGVGHFVFTSAANADLGTGILHFESKYQVEQYLVQSGLKWTIIGPAAFMDDFKDGWYKYSLTQGKLNIVMPADKPLAFVCSEDIGAMAALAIDQPGRLAGKRVDIAGDEITGPQLAVLFSHHYGHSIAYEEVPLQVAERYSHDLAVMFEYFQNTGLKVDIAGLRSSYPEVGWHSFADWLALRKG